MSNFFMLSDLFVTVPHKVVCRSSSMKNPSIIGRTRSYDPHFALPLMSSATSI
jgi:hypothetical protein